MLSNIAEFCPVMTEPIRMTYISAVVGLDLHTLQEKKSVSSPQGKDLCCGRGRPFSIGFGWRATHDRPRQDFFLPCFQVWAFLFHSHGRSRRQLALLALPIGPAAVIYSFIYSFFYLAQQGSALGFEMEGATQYK